jgi:hypothetical protein
MSKPVDELRDTHLTEDQIDDALIGDLNAASAAHLKACANCSARLAAAEMPLASFKSVSLAWSERHSATMPAVTPLRPRMGARGRLMAWSAALSVMIAAGVAVPVLLHQDHPPAAGDHAQALQSPAAVQTATVGASGTDGPTDDAAASNETKPPKEVVSRDNISQDNAMLRDIDRELDASAATPAVLTLESPHGPLAKPQTVNE